MPIKYAHVLAYAQVRAMSLSAISLKVVANIAASNGNYTYHAGHTDFKSCLLDAAICTCAASHVFIT